MPKRSFLILICAVTAASYAPATLPTVTPESAVAAVQDCANATLPGRVDTAVLEGRGWVIASIESDGEAVETPLRIYGKGSNSPLILTSEASDASGRACLVSGGLEAGESFEKLAATLDESFERTGTKDGDHYFRAGNDIAILSQTGTQRETTFRVTVIEFGDDS